MSLANSSATRSRTRCSTDTSPLGMDWHPVFVKPKCCWPATNYYEFSIGPGTKCARRANARRTDKHTKSAGKLSIGDHSNGSLCFVWLDGGFPAGCRIIHVARPGLRAESDDLLIFAHLSYPSLPACRRVGRVDAPFSANSIKGALDDGS